VHIHLDPVGGLAGDMFLGALLHGWPELEEEVVASVRAAGLPQSWTVTVVPGTSGGMTGNRFVVSGEADGHPVGRFRDIRSRLLAAPLAEGVRSRSLDIFSLLARAEARIHGVAVDDVHFHELADWDSVADIVGAAAAIEALGSASWSVGDLPMGSGTVMTAHGRMPVPAPATALLLAGYRLVDDGVPGERVTPTGAALLAHLQARQDGRRPSGTVQVSGHGLGTRMLEGMANILRVIALDTGQAAVRGAVGVISFEIDDQTPEELSAGLDRLRAQDDVLDVVQVPVTGKKGRVAVSVRVLCRTGAVQAVIEACFAQTTTIGLRWRTEERVELAREEVTIAGHGAKRVRRPDGTVTTKADLDALVDAATDHAGRARLRRRIEGEADDGQS